MRKVTDYMKGKPRLQAQVLHMLETKVLEAPPPKAREESCLPPSCNQLRRISKEHWLQILTLCDPAKFDNLEGLSKQALMQIGCFMGRVSPACAPKSRHMPTFASWLLERSANETANRYLDIVWRSLYDGKVVGVDWNAFGVYEVIEEGCKLMAKSSGQKLMLVHKSSGRKLEMPQEAQGNPVIFENWLEDMAYFSAEFSNIKVNWIFVKRNHRINPPLFMYEMEDADWTGPTTTETPRSARSSEHEEAETSAP